MAEKNKQTSTFLTVLKPGTNLLTCVISPSLRSLTTVVEQMEQFSSRLGELSSRVESTHEHTAQGLEQGARRRDEQLRSTYPPAPSSAHARSRALAQVGQETSCLAGAV